MQKSLYLMLLTVIFSSCSYYTQPKYTKVENIVRLTPGMDKQAVSNMLGIDPYDVYTIQKDGSTILLYHYKHKQRELNTINEMNEKGLTEEKNEPKYLKPSRLFVMFDKEAKLNSVWTDEGTENALRIIQLDQQARRYLSASATSTALNDSLLFAYAGHDIEKNEAPNPKKKSATGKIIAVLLITALAVFGASTL